MPRGFPLQDTGPGMSEMFHDLQVEQEEERAKIRANLTVDNLESTICFYLRGLRGDGKCPCDDRRDDQKYCCLELAETIIKDLKE